MFEVLIFSILEITFQGFEHSFWICNTLTALFKTKVNFRIKAIYKQPSMKR